MTLSPDDSAATISPTTARQLLERATPRGWRLLELFAEHQLLELPKLREQFGMNQKGLNALIGRLSQLFLGLQGDPHFYIHLPDLGAWAIGHSTRTNLRIALKVAYDEQQRKLRFPGSDDTGRTQPPELTG